MKRNAAAFLEGELGLPHEIAVMLSQLYGDQAEAKLRRDPYKTLMQVCWMTAVGSWCWLMCWKWLVNNVDVFGDQAEAKPWRDP